MTLSDPIADMFTRIRNALAVRHDDVYIPYSKLKLAIIKILKEEGFIKHFEVLSEDLKKRTIRVVLKYAPNGQPLIRTIKRVSKVGKRHYVQKSEIPKVLNGFGINFISNSKGIMTGMKARLNNVGGELIGEVS